MAEKKSETEALQLSELKAFHVEKTQMLNEIAENKLKLEVEREEIKSQNLELQHKLEAERSQREKDQGNHVTMVTELHKLVAAEKEALHQMKHQLDVELLGFKTRVRDLTALMKRNEKQFYDLNCELQDLKAHVTGDTEKLTTSSHDADELQIIPQTSTSKSPKRQDLFDEAIAGQDDHGVERPYFSVEDTASVESDNDLSDILDHFITTTAMHGIGQIIGAKWIVLRVIWVILTLAAIGMLIFHLYSIIDSFRRFPKQTQVSLGLGNPQYPAITICNENIIRKSALENMDGLGTLKSFMNYLNHGVLSENRTIISDSGNNINGNSEEALTWLESLGPVYNSLQLTDNEKKMIEAALNRSTYDGRDTDRDITYLLEEIFQTIYMNVDREMRAQASHNISDMLISCTFNGYSCYPENFTLYQTSSLGNCWTLSSPTMIAKTTGPRAGLSLILFLQNNEFLDGFATGYGARLAIHAQETKSVPLDDGVFISAASETNIGLTKGTISRVDTPHGKCNTGTRFQAAYGFLYSRQACQIMCVMEDLLTTCGCYGNFYEEYALEVDMTAHVCNTSKERRCLNEKLWKIDEMVKACECDNPCSETYYYYSVSTRQWPTDSYANFLLGKVCDRDPVVCQELSQLTDSRHLLSKPEISPDGFLEVVETTTKRSNFVKINIFFETLNFEEIEEQPLMDNFQFLASIGGALGLWIGLSVLSFCEVVQLIVRILDFMFCPHSCICDAPKPE